MFTVMSGYWRRNRPRIGEMWFTPKSVAMDTRSVPEGADCIAVTRASASPASFRTRRARS
jgi:hypothetical protein